MAKKIASYVRLQIPAGQANPSPPVGPALGQAGVNIMEFCKAFNAKTGDMESGTPTPVIISIFEDRSFEFITKTPPASYLLKKSANIKKGSGEPNKNKVGTVTVDQLREIYETKKADLNALDADAGIKIIAGTAQSMGLEVEGL